MGFMTAMVGDAVRPRPRFARPLAGRQPLGRGGWTGAMGYTRQGVAAMALKAGWLRIGRLRGASVRLHWSVPLGMLVFTGLRLAPGAWLGFVLLLLVHELGHAIAVVRGGLRLVAVDVLGFG